MNLDKYRIPQSAIAGEWLELPASDGARFLVKLPSQANREWQRENMQLLTDHGVDVKFDDKGELQQRTAIDAGGAVRWQEARLEAFARLCVLDGPPGFDRALLLTEFYPALQKLFALAQQRAEAEEVEAARASGES